jgi:hypothetical protein
VRRVIFRQGPFGQGKFDLLLFPRNRILKVDRMVKNLPLNPETPPRRRGRPSKQEEVRLALAAVGCDPAAIDPLRILAGIAADETIAPTARVAAARTLLQHDLAPAETKQPAKHTAEARPSKKAEAARAAATAGQGSEWGRDLHWGGQSQ